MRRLAFQVLPVPWLRRRWAATGVAAGTTRECQLLVDVSVISQRDDRTGIQRVVRNLFRQLEQAPPAGYRIRAIAATRSAGYRYLGEDGGFGAVVQAGAGDLFLGLDLAAQLVPRHAAQLADWKRRGARLAFLVYDLLPAQQPQWFRPRTSRDFRRWLRIVAILADRVVCISNTVQGEFHAWMRGYGVAQGIPSEVIPLGTDPFGFVGAEAPGTGGARLAAAGLDSKFVLMVGTLEPRKGHADVLDAFEGLWSKGEATQLVFAGRAGWMVEPLTERVRAHRESGRRLHWINAPSDAHLMELYQRASGVIMASKGEGLGLPILEARCWNKPVLVRDIPIFREIAGEGATFFPAGPPERLPAVLSQWIARLDSGRRDIPVGPAISWKQSRDHLVQALAVAG